MERVPLTGQVTIYNSPAITLESSSTAGYSMSLYPNDHTTGGNAILFSGTTTTSGALNATSTLSVTGTSTMNGNVTVGADLTVDGTCTLTGAVTCSDTLATPSINVNSGGALTSLYAVSATITTADGDYTALNCTIVVVGSMCFFNFPGLSFSASSSAAVNINGGWPSGIAPLNSTYGYFPGQVAGTWTMMGYYVFAYGSGPDIYLMTSSMTNLTQGTEYYFPAFVISWAI